MERWYEGWRGTGTCKRSGEASERFQRSLKRLNMAAVEASHHEEQGKEGLIMLSSSRIRLYRWLARIVGRSVWSNMQLMRFNQHCPRSEIDWIPSASGLSLSYCAPGRSTVYTQAIVHRGSRATETKGRNGSTTDQGQKCLISSVTARAERKRGRAKEAAQITLRGSKDRKGLAGSRDSGGGGAR